MTKQEEKTILESPGTHKLVYEVLELTKDRVGDTMKNYGVRSCQVDTATRKDVSTWELYRKRPVKHGLQNSAYFDKKTFERVFPKL